MTSAAPAGAALQMLEEARAKMGLPAPEAVDPGVRPRP